MGNFFQPITLLALFSSPSDSSISPLSISINRCILQHILSRHDQYKGFFFVEGVHVTYRNTPEDIEAPEAFQGENLMGIRTHPVTTGNSETDKRIIYSPHTFGPDTWNQSYFKESDFPKNMPSIWETFFGFITTTIRMFAPLNLVTMKLNLK